MQDGQGEVIIANFYSIGIVDNVSIISRRLQIRLRAPQTTISLG